MNTIEIATANQFRSPGLSQPGRDQADCHGRARQQEGRSARLGGVQRRHPARPPAVRDRHHRHPARIRAGAQGAPVPVRPARRRSADRRQDRRGGDRHADLLLGPAGAAAARSGRQGAAAAGCAVEHPGRQQCGHRGHDHFLTAAGQRLHRDPAGRRTAVNRCGTAGDGAARAAERAADQLGAERQKVAAAMA